MTKQRGPWLKPRAALFRTSPRRRPGALAPGWRFYSRPNCSRRRRSASSSMDDAGWSDSEV